ncbi:hypothetical protein BDQ94DRAFT_155308 [Aspergillus welwitschiae]|uniref:Uncharacterized protein n=1 Tax=Aspergillus welwitschiae TaxID=1341132 RepID=A0A3F3PI22_9EURO|nr:hypothetical protein BDQ94DRAFT_155308 [Aspergillus welwitschiae]RDH26590.1 hypothetical protein BDQ94DRAFT_155308 [Aspergillus welwitschiae]
MGWRRWSIGVSSTQRYLENGSRSDQWAQWRPLGNSWATVVRQSTMTTDSSLCRSTFHCLEHRCPVPDRCRLG